MKCCYVIGTYRQLTGQPIRSEIAKFLKNDKFHLGYFFYMLGREQPRVTKGGKAQPDAIPCDYEKKSEIRPETPFILFRYYGHN